MAIWVTIIATALFGLVLLSFWYYTWLLRDKKLPPGPKGFPIIGSLHLLGELPHRDLHRLSQKYGPIMHLRLGSVPTIVVSSPQAAELFLKTHDLVFASRPPVETVKHMTYGQKDLVFAPYGSYWRNMRRMATIELLSNLKVNSFKSIREEELGLLIHNLREAAQNHVPVDVSSKLSSLSADMTCLTVLGKKYADGDLDERGFKAVIHEVSLLAGIPNLGDFIPFIAILDLKGLNRRAKSVAKVFDSFLEKIIDEHLHLHQSKDEKYKRRDFVDVMLDLMDSQETEYQIDRSSIKAIILDMIVAAVDTTATTIEWAISELIKHPNVMKKMQEELEKVVGFDRMVQESDLDKLEYMDMVVKETFRLHPPAPLLIHESIENCIIDNFHIPKSTRVMVNVWAIGRDPNVWIDPNKFFPERFYSSHQVDLKGRHFELIPFGSGRRSCPGMQLGLTTVRLVLTQLVHCFDWKLSNGMFATSLDMAEKFGLVCPRAQELIAIPIYRLHN